MPRDDGRRAIDLGRPDRARNVVPVDEYAAILQIEHRAFAHRRDRRLILWIDAVVQRLPRDGAIHRARIDVPVAEPRRDSAGDRSFAGA